MQDHDSQEVQIQALFFAQFHFPRIIYERRTSNEHDKNARGNLILEDEHK